MSVLSISGLIKVMFAGPSWVAGVPDHPVCDSFGRCFRRSLPAAARLLFVLSLLAGPEAAAQSPSTARLTGTVTEAATGVPISAELLIEGRAGVRTDTAGHFRLDSVPVGRLVVQVRALGFLALAHEMEVRDGSNAPVAIRLVRLPSTLTSVRTVARSPERERFEDAPATSALSIRGSEISTVPAVGERDVLRVIAFLPGVGVRNDFSSSLNVRGGEADQNLVLLDGVPIYNPFHLGGLFGTFMDAAVGEVEMLTGGFAAPYGGRLSSVLEVKSAEETRSGVHGSTDLSLLSSSVRLAGAVNDGRTSWSVAGRRTYADKVIQAIQGANEFPYHFQDAQLHVRSHLPGGGTVSATVYGGKDVLDGTGTATSGMASALTERGVGFDWGNTVGGLTYTQPVGARTALIQQLSVSTFHTNFGIVAESLSLAQDMRESRLAGRLEHGRGAHTWTVGYELSSFRSGYREQLPVTNSSAFPDALASDGDTLITQRAAVGTVFVDDIWQVSDRLTLRTGLRFERVNAAGWAGASPRLAAKYLLTRNFALTASAGRFAQWTHAVRNEDLPLRLFDFWMTSDTDVPVGHATHLILGAEHWSSPTRFVRVEAYRKDYTDLVEPASTVDPRVRPSLLRTFDGAAYGVDVFARQLPRGGVSGWIAYSYGMSWRERNGERYFPAHDRRHSGDVVLNYAPGRGYTFGFHAGASTGTPYTGWAGRMSRWHYDPVTKNWGLASRANDADIVNGARNHERLPFYSRVDLSVERRIDVGSMTLRPMLSVVNVFNRRNVLLYALDENVSPAAIVSYAQLPLLPSLGMRVEF